MSENIEAFIIVSSLALFATGGIEAGQAMAVIAVTYLASKIEV